MFRVLYFLLFNSLCCLCLPPVEHSGRSFRNALSQQSFQTILQSIEERLRNLDQVYALRYSSRPEITTDKYVRKIELLETKLARIESLFEVQLEKISENMSSKNFKDDIVKDQIFRKIDSIYERINHKLGYIEGKVDMDILKLQSKIENTITKIERLDHSISVRQADMETEITEAVEIMENVKTGISEMENKIINATAKTFAHVIDKQTEILNSEFSNITKTVKRVENNVNNSFAQCNQKDSPNESSNEENELFKKKFEEYENKINSYGSKMTNMYNELWKKSEHIENSIKDNSKLANLTRKEIQDNIKNVLLQFGNKDMSNGNQNDASMDIVIDSFTNTLQRKFSEIGRKMETNFQNVMLAQNLFLESCHRIQMDESQLENKIGMVLEKLLDSFTNKSVLTFREIQNMEEMLKSHDAHVYRSINQNTNTIIKLSEKTSEDRKKIEKILSMIKHDIGNSVATIHDILSSESEGNIQKFDIITNVLQEMQEQVNDLDNRLNEDNLNYNSKQIIQEAVSEMKSLLNKETLKQMNNSLVENTNTLTTIDNLIQNIYHILNNIDTKLNKTYLDYYFKHETPHRFGLKINSNVKNIDVNEVKNLSNETSLVNKDRNLTTNLADIDKENFIFKDDNNEPIDVILEIFPEENSRENTKNISEANKKDLTPINEEHISFLKRFNYTLVKNENQNLFTLPEESKEADLNISEFHHQNTTESNQEFVTESLVTNQKQLNNTNFFDKKQMNIEVTNEEINNSSEVGVDIFDTNLSAESTQNKNDSSKNIEEHNLETDKNNGTKVQENIKPDFNFTKFQEDVKDFTPTFNLTQILFDEISQMQRETLNLTHLQDSLENTDSKNNTNEDGFLEAVSDLPEIPEYDEDYEE